MTCHTPSLKAVSRATGRAAPGKTNAPKGSVVDKQSRHCRHYLLLWWFSRRDFLSFPAFHPRYFQASQVSKLPEVDKQKHSFRREFQSRSVCSVSGACWCKLEWKTFNKEIKTFDAKNLMRSDLKTQRKFYFRKNNKRKYLLDQKKV